MEAGLRAARLQSAGLRGGMVSAPCFVEFPLSMSIGDITAIVTCFTLTDMACSKSCKKRVWRSEVEASLNGHDRAAQNLQARQENRDRCRCPMITRSHDE